MQSKTVLILWDSSHIWGLMAYRAIRSLGIPCRLVKAIEISQGCLSCKSDPYDNKILLVPGGNARQKAHSLGTQGLENIRNYVSEGGFYLGFCGGTGLALSEGPHSLALCPLRRARFEKRFYHFLSGHIKASRESGPQVSLPVWWPGRFEMTGNPPVAILARYEAPDSDLWLSDLPLSKIPRNILASWAKERGLAPGLGFPKGEPLLMKSSYGKGVCILSYSHLETPASAEANAWLCALLEKYGEFSPGKKYIPEWNTSKELKDGKNDFLERIAFAHSGIVRICKNSLEHGLLFRRKEWLYGWQGGFSGMALNNILAFLSFISENCSQMPDQTFQKNLFILLDLFIHEAESWLWTNRLDLALRSPGNGEAEKKKLEIFGHPMLGGGLAGKILQKLEEYIWQAQDKSS